MNVKDIWARHVARMGGDTIAFKILKGKYEIISHSPNSCSNNIYSVALCWLPKCAKI